jgi:hypothetical protein
MRHPLLALIGCFAFAPLASAQDVVYDNGLCRMEVDGTELRFIGCNVNVQSGGGDTGAMNGAGNLIVGYNESTAAQVRSGSHNLVVGPEHEYVSYGTMISGHQNTTSGRYSAVVGGRDNVAAGVASSMVSGRFNSATAAYAAALGGGYSVASGQSALVLGGNGNTASAQSSTVIGGATNSAIGIDGVVVGSSGAVASAGEAVVANILLADLAAEVDLHTADIASNAAAIGVNVDVIGTQAVEIAANAAAIADVAADYLTSVDVVGLATEAWVAGQGYLAAVSWADIGDVPADLADGDDGLTSVAWADIGDVPADLADGDDGLTSVAWADIGDVPADIADGDDGLTSVAWADIADVPADLADGDDGVPGLEAYVWVDDVAGDVWVEGANLVVANGSGASDSTNGLGNLVIGYNRDTADVRTGSHNLVLGDDHTYTSYSGIVGGSDNELAAPLSMVLTGARNAVRGVTGQSVIVSGLENVVDVVDYIDPSFEFRGRSVVLTGKGNNVFSPLAALSTGERMQMLDYGTWNNAFAFVGTGFIGTTNAYNSAYVAGAARLTNTPHEVIH